jgi:hypothetical protein
MQETGVVLTRNTAHIVTFLDLRRLMPRIRFAILPARAYDIDQVVVDLRVSLDLIGVLQDKVVLEVTLRSVDHEGLVLQQLQLHLVPAFLVQVMGDGVSEQLLPLDATLHVRHQHLS